MKKPEEIKEYNKLLQSVKNIREIKKQTFENITKELLKIVETELKKNDVFDCINIKTDYSLNQAKVSVYEEKTFVFNIITEEPMYIASTFSYDNDNNNKYYLLKSIYYKIIYKLRENIKQIK